ncbi:Holliday junction branch migration protein RuvA [Aerococcus sanguinicola]|uniref:Holliday junction branch migration protein RuvA n=1 Tax=unclassified Aerococcus TaxID=2618060 RepID=UPI0008A44538|nr:MULTISPECIES: Holliday junction branch migration protein RuvA [unclassified Aerococcus]KAB0647785.1 Holliday junction branch migration protein RuvA [Aerococcus sanguinicola]MDK6232972.1 Holliday junction branch migration protein RuvA [Aerococcus sp. UMB10185]MDK6855266.1 Holliday junction branch migration protein RuvA [Aerococcus sp. UMB7533]MDK8502097.1 Holliday junction branch migration protein RuvA [Aerococcus sp. UMB1112A]OFN05249.1 Holliday junction ATP-dependent DNA helicase RuvA [Aer
MYAYFKGKITSILPNAIIIEVNGIGYQVIMANPYRFSSQVGQEARIWLYQAVSQDSIRLYGFSDEAEKDLFLHLISVSGIGPRSALSILSLDDHEGLIRAIDQADSQFLTKFPGVGKKTAQQIILDLQGKLTSDVEDKAASQAASASPSHPITQELEEALDSLGYSQRDIQRVVKQMDFDQVATTSDAIRQALRLMTAR